MTERTMYSSRPPFNDDPNPMVYRGERYAMGSDRPYLIGRGEEWTDRIESRPRPEFDRTQHNPTNPALAELRRQLAEAGAENAKPIIGIRLRTLEWALEEHETGWQKFTPETAAHIRHAMKVIGRVHRLMAERSTS